ncbi:MAG TPA: preprotein translocase subunit SecE [Candidatus Paceibacterota bacterium]
MASIFQYIKDTQGELRHVAWPTRTQTVVYTVLVAALSVGVALYLGLFDFLFTTSLTRFISALPELGTPAPAIEIETAPATSAEVAPPLDLDLGPESE